uniref:Truncated vpu protein n=1 Tax=Human immunodeficiency virus type 1 TaxID=11676 RepID=A0A0H3YC43_HV1|nr:truncated vpu protein [Human immunodeficiency virus 1]
MLDSIDYRITIVAFIVALIITVVV